ncbi:MAG: hypothetical protein A2X59_00910 [Nitrospirae bacterium GWC2_42_7]|nr:MAG: hypothetical protein A2X59_00910 [Nitrospirae bacterium GWC2_42_7]
MKKIIFILMALLLASFLFTACQKAKEPEGKKEEQVQEKQLAQQIQKEEINKQLSETKRPIEKETPLKRPAGCDEAYKNYLKKANEQITEKEKEYLLDICKIPIRRHGEDKLSPLKWWKDEYGYEDEIYEALNYVIKMEEYSNVKPEYIEPIKNIALNSKFSKLKERAIIVLHGIDKKKSIPILKEVLRKEVEEREITEERRRLPIIWAGRLLSKEGEYEYAFPYLMKAKVFEISAIRRDRRAITYMYIALKDKDPRVRIDSAWWLAEIGERSEELFLNVTACLRDQRCDKYYAIEILGKLKDKRAIPNLEEVIKEENIHAVDAQKSIDFIKDETKAGRK